MARIHIISMGVGNLDLLTHAASLAIAQSQVLIGDKRLLEPYSDSGKQLHYATRAPKVLEIVDSCAKDERIAILVSGDVGFYSLSKSVLAGLRESAQLHCGIGSLQYFASKLQISWQDTCLLSLHGRETNLLDKVRKYHKVFLLTGGAHSVNEICGTLVDKGLGTVQVAVGERLSYPDERISQGSAIELQSREFAELSVLMIFNENAEDNPLCTHGLQDECFERGNAPMTKQEVRSVSLSKLELRVQDVFYDIGAGTGSVSIEAGLLLTKGKVFALERDSESVQLIKTNIAKFHIDNIEVIESYAPEGLDNLPAPHKAFIGGSGGKLELILDSIYEKNPNCRVVLNCIALESLSACLAYYKQKTDYKLDIVNITVAKSRKLAGYNMMTGSNPIYIITAMRIGETGA